jgi:hypothetical protein
MNRIKTISAYMCTFLNILLIALPILTILQWLLLDWVPFKKLVLDGFFCNPIQTHEGPVNIATIPLTILTKSIGVLTSVLCSVPAWLGLLFLRTAFTNYKNGRIFVYENAKAYQRIGWLFFMNALLFNFIFQLGMTFVATFSNPPGHRYISCSFGTPNLESIFCGVILIIISWVMIEGHRLQSEQELTI